MQHSPLEANQFSASQEIPHILRNPKVHYRIHKCPPPVLSCASSIQSLPHSPLPADPPYIPRTKPLVPSPLLSRTALPIQVTDNCSCLATKPGFRWGIVSISPNLQARGPPLVGCPRMLFQYIRSYPPYWRPFLHPKLEDTPCRGDRDPLFVALAV